MDMDEASNQPKSPTNQPPLLNIKSKSFSSLFRSPYFFLGMKSKQNTREGTRMDDSTNRRAYLSPSLSYSFSRKANSAMQTLKLEEEREMAMKRPNGIRRYEMSHRPTLSPVDAMTTHSADDPTGEWGLRKIMVWVNLKRRKLTGNCGKY
jgi:hypothetical protein